MVQAFLMYSDLSASGDSGDESWTFTQDQFVEYFRDQMAIYESYWKDDPVFDLTNTKRAAPHLPCPDVDEHMLIRLCKYALESNFGWPKRPAVKPDFDVHEQLRGLTQEIIGSVRETHVGLQVTGPGGGEWQLTIKDGRPVSATPGRPVDSAASLYLNSNTFARLVRRELTVRQSLQTAQTILEGNGLPNLSLEGVLERLVASPAVHEQN